MLANVPKHLLDMNITKCSVDHFVKIKSTEMILKGFVWSLQSTIISLQIRAHTNTINRLFFIRVLKANNVSFSVRDR